MDDEQAQQGRERPVGEVVAGFSPPPLPGPAVIEGRTVRLERLDPGRHAAAIHEAAAGADWIWDYLGYGPFASAEDYAAWAETQAQSADPMLYAFVDRASGRALGVGSFLRIDAANGVIEIGHILITPPMQRTTAASEAIMLMVDWAFDAGYRRVEWKCNALNAPSCAAARRFGFAYEGTFRQHMIVKGRNRDTAWFALTDADWPRVKARWDAWLDPGNFDAGGTAVMTKVGTLIDGALQGYSVDKASYDAGITDISQLKDPAVAAKFDTDGDGKADLAGCIPGWGCERVIEHELDEYGLRDTVTHNQGAYQAMIADVIARHSNKQPILYYTWTPYWVAGALVPGKDVEWLSVPYTSLPDGETGNTTFNGKNMGFAVDSIGVVARNDFLEANPSARALFEVAKIDINDISAENKQITDGENTSADIDRHVDAWIEAHRGEYDGWLKAARAAGG